LLVEFPRGKHQQLHQDNYLPVELVHTPRQLELSTSSSGWLAVAAAVADPELAPLVELEELVVILHLED
jgi:hypothetical protein